MENNKNKAYGQLRYQTLVKAAKMYVSVIQFNPESAEKAFSCFLPASWWFLWYVFVGFLSHRTSSLWIPYKFVFATVPLFIIAITVFGFDFRGLPGFLKT